MENLAQLPDALLVGGYRGYSVEQRLELLPLTVLFGRNDSGKSALLRALPLLSASIRRGGAQALDMAGPVVRGATFDDLTCRGIDRDENLEMRDMYLGLRWPHDIGLDVAFHWPDRRLVEVSGLRLPGGAWWRHRPVREPLPRGTVLLEALEDPNRTFEVGLMGLHIERVGDGAPPELVLAQPQWNEFSRQVQWIGATRRPLGRRAEYSSLAGSFVLEPDGANIIAWLAERPDQIKEVSRWYEDHLGARLSLRELPRVGYEALLEYVAGDRRVVNLLDTGEGNVQVLPILAALGAAATGKGPAVVVLEEPESHLHPKLQMALAKRIEEIVKSRVDVRIVLETHSEHLLLAIQKLVLEGLDPAEVGLYWVEQRADGRTCAERVEIRSDGTFDEKWPPGVFEDTLRLAYRIMQLQLERGDAGAGKVGS